MTPSGLDNIALLTLTWILISDLLRRHLGKESARNCENNIHILLTIHWCYG